MRKTVILSSIIEGNYNNDILRGVTRYARHHGRWIVRLAHGASHYEASLGLQRADGVLIRGSERLPAKHPLRQFHGPIVEYDLRYDEPIFPTVSADHAASGRLAAEHLLARGFRSFAGYAEKRFVDQRIAYQHFAERLQAAGHDCLLISKVYPNLSAWSYERSVQALMKSLLRLKLPVGILLGWDVVVSRMLEACDRCGLRIPEDVALIGRGNDEVLCESVWPSLTSVDINAEEIGFRAAEQLDALMQGAPADNEPILIPPTSVVARMSTDVVAVEDQKIAEALRLMRQACPEQLSINELCRQIGLCRRSFEYRFGAALGRTPFQEMRRMRMEHAKHILLYSATKITAVAEMCGYRNFSDFSRNFQAEFKMTPGACRARAHAPNLRAARALSAQ